MKLLQRTFISFFIVSLSVLLTSNLYADNNTRIPAKGLTQEQVKAQFGEPETVGATVGKPPITRWDYKDYTVVFEGKYVIHSFMHNKLMRPILNPKPEAAPKPAKVLQKVEGQPVEVEQKAKEQPAKAEEKDSEQEKPEASEEMPEQDNEETAETVEETPQASMPEPKEDVDSVEEVPEAKADSAKQAQTDTKTDGNKDSTDKTAEKPKDLNFEEAPQDGKFDKFGY